MSLVSRLVAVIQAIGGDIKNKLTKPTTNGLLVFTGTINTITRSIVGTNRQITVTSGDAVSANPQIAIADNPIFTGTQAATMPMGTTAQRSSPPQAGEFRYNLDDGRPECVRGGAYLPFGELLQCIIGTVNTVSGTTQIPFDNTTPLITEGFQVLNVSITPKSANSKILIICNLNVHTSSTLVNRNITGVVWAGNSIAYTHTVNTGKNQAPEALPLCTWFDSTDTTTKTLQIRVGADGSGTTYVGGSGNVTLNGNRFTDYIILEVLGG